MMKKINVYMSIKIMAGLHSIEEKVGIITLEDQVVGGT